MSQPVALIGNPPDASWAQIVETALRPLNLGQVELISTTDLADLNLANYFGLALIDTVAIAEPEKLVAQLHSALPDLLIVVVSSSLTWRRARDMFLAGAVDYVRKTPDARQLQRSILEVLERADRVPKGE